MLLENRDIGRKLRNKMKKFEYIVLVFDSRWKYDYQEATLNSYGEDGWELILMNQNGDLIFKREKNGKNRIQGK